MSVVCLSGRGLCDGLKNEEAKTRKWVVKARRRRRRRRLEVVGLIHLHQGRDKWRASVKTVLNPRIV